MTKQKRSMQNIHFYHAFLQNVIKKYIFHKFIGGSEYIDNSIKTSLIFRIQTIITHLLNYSYYYLHIAICHYKLCFFGVCQTKILTVNFIKIHNIKKHRPKFFHTS